jgi:hypothetical protein
MRLFAISTELAAGLEILVGRYHPVAVHPPHARAMDALMMGYPTATHWVERRSICLSHHQRRQVEHARSFLEDLWEAARSSEALLVWHVEQRLRELACSFDQYSLGLFLQGARLHSIEAVVRGQEPHLGDWRPQLLVYPDGLELWSFAPRPPLRFRSGEEYAEDPVPV